MHGFSANKLLECVDAQMFAIIIDLKLRKVFVIHSLLAKDKRLILCNICNARPKLCLSVSIHKSLLNLRLSQSRSSS